MIKFLLILFVFSITYCEAQFIEHQIVTCETCGPSFIRVGDITGNGYEDIVVTSSRDRKLSYYPGMGHKVFGKQELISTDVAEVNYMNVLDYDNDGKLDIVIDSGRHGQLSYFKNNGDGDYTQIILTPTMFSSRYKSNVYFEDFDGDGSLDFFVNDEIGNFQMLRNENDEFVEDSNLLDPSIIPLQDEYHFEDLNGDNKLDLISFSEAKTMLTIWHYKDEGDYEKYYTFDYKEQIYNLDFRKERNGTSIKILVGTKNGLSILSKNNQNEYESSQVLKQNYIDNSGAKFIDFNSDGYDDIVFGSGELLNVIINSNGNLVNEQVRYTKMTGSTGRFQVADFNKDGTEDVVMSHQNEISVLYGTYKEIVDNQMWLEKDSHYIELISESIYTPTTLAILDMNNDGALDIICASRQDHELNWFPSRDGKFEEKLFIDAPSGGCGTHKIKTGDFNMDGAVDFIIHLGRQYASYIFDNDGEGKFTKRRFALNDVERSYLITIDFDKDGDLDLVTRDRGPLNDKEKISWFENDGFGNFGNEVILHTSNYYINDWDVGDLDQDGNLDIILTYRVSNQATITDGGIEIVFLDKNQSKREALDSKSNYSPYYFTMDDLNNDGNLDIVYKENRNIKISIYNGNGEFHELQEIYSHYGFYNIFIHDIDSDCDKDLFISSNKAFVWIENMNNGQYKQHKISTTNSLENMLFYDIDGDSDYDIVSLSHNSLYWFENQIEQKNISPCNLSTSNDVDPIIETHYKIKIDPNPTDDFVIVEIKKPTHLIIYNSIGLKIGYEELLVGQNKISLINYPSGTYYLRFNSIDENFRVIKKVVKVD